MKIEHLFIRSTPLTDEESLHMANYLMKLHNRTWLQKLWDSIKMWWSKFKNN